MNTLITIHEQDVNPDAPVIDFSDFQERDTARAILSDSAGRIALLHVGLHEYHKLPGGGVDDDSDIYAALARELREEIGCEAEVTGEVGMTVEYRDQFRLKQTSYCFTARQVGEMGEPSFSESERKKQFSVVWADNLDAAIALLEGEDPADYVGAFVHRRELALLQAARVMFGVENPGLFESA